VIEDLVHLGNKILSIKVYVVFRGNDYTLICREITFVENGEIKIRSECNNPNFAPFHIINKIFANITSQPLVSVQPLSGPTGNLFYLDYLYEI